MRELKRYLSYIGKYRLSYWSVLIVTLLTSAALRLAGSYMNKLIFNALEYRSANLFARAALLCLVLVLLNCLWPYHRYFQIRIVRKIVFDIKLRLFEKLMKLDMDFYGKHHSGEAQKTLNQDANSLKDSYFSHIYWVFGRLVNGVASLAAMTLYSPFLTLISVFFSLVTVSVSVAINKRIKQADMEIQSKTSHLAAYLGDILSGFATLKMYSGSSILAERYQEENRSVTEAQMKRTKKAAFLEAISFLLGILASFGAIGAGALLVRRGLMDYGTVMAVVSLQMGVSGLIQSFGSALATLSSSLARADRVFDFLELECPEPADGSAPKPRPGSLPIEVTDLSFSYGDGRDVLKSFSLGVPESGKIMLTGESGCGKSTLLKLLAGLTESPAGSVRIYGHDIRELSPGQLREFVTYLPQNSYLFEGTVGENIAYGFAGKGHNLPTSADIEKAARLACADGFIRELPLGYDTPVSAGGGSLSGGQRQRIALARAFLKNSPILLMDEPSAALDAISEEAVHRAVKEHMRDKTVLMVTHRTGPWEDIFKNVSLL